FNKDQDYLFDAINKSIDLDASLFEYEIKASIAHAKALADIGIYTSEELTEVITTLEKIKEDIAAGLITPEEIDEDVHMWIERLLTKNLGEIGKRIHTARSRNDQVVTIVRLYLRDCYKNNLENLKKIITALTDLAAQHTDTLLPAFTHLQPAQPISLAFYLMNYAYKLKRDYEKMVFFADNLNYSPLGSGAVSGVNYPIDRNKTANELEFNGYLGNALDGVSDRDYVNDYLYINSLIFNHLSQLSEDFIIWNTPQFNFITLSDSFSSGSSIMPQKKNPDAFELIRGKAAIAAGRLGAITTLGKGIPSSYNKDLQEDKKLLFDAFDDLNLTLEVLQKMLLTTTFNKEQLASSVRKGFLNATDLADELVRKNIPFRQAHQIVGNLVSIATKKQLSLEELDLEDFKTVNPIFDDWVYDVLDYNNCLSNRQSAGSANPKFVATQINEIESWVAGL
ncbi:MAG: argininosuccinate lyase, partial [Actinomycetales bacterium]